MPKKKILTFPKFFYFALIIGFILGIGLIFVFSSYFKTPSEIIQKYSQNEAEDKAQRLATLSASPSIIPNVETSNKEAGESAYFIPAQFGKSINISILTYHFIGNNPDPTDLARDNLSVSADIFDAQMGYLKSSGYNSITFDTLYASLKSGSSLPLKPLILTFDDGYIDFYLNAFPILQKYNFKAVSFIPTGLIGTSYYMSWNQIKELDSSNLISFQAHSINHPNLASLNNDQLNFQIKESKKTLESQLNKPVNTFAYPYGTSNQLVQQAVKEAGYIGAAGKWYSKVVSEGTIYNMPRVKIPGNISLEEFARRI